MRDKISIEELQAELDGIAITYEAQIWQSAGHERPADFAEWQKAFQDARQDPFNEALAAESTRQLHRLLFD